MDPLTLPVGPPVLMFVVLLLFDLATRPWLGRYTRDLITPQAWVGTLAYPGNDPAAWLNHHAIVTKRWAEELRYQRGKSGGGGTSGFSLFSVECWFRHSYLTEATPYPVYQAMKQAFAPIGIAIKTTQRRFFQGGKISTDVLVTNDDEQFRDLTGLSLQCELATPEGDSLTLTDPRPIGDVKYYSTHSQAMSIPIPQLQRDRVKATLVTRLLQGGKEISRTTDDVELFKRPAEVLAVPENVTVILRGKSLADLGEGKPLRQRIESGATVIVFAPSKEIVQLFKGDVLDVRNDPQRDIAEFADWVPARGTILTKNLGPMDIKWWARKGDERAFIASSSH